MIKIYYFLFVMLFILSSSMVLANEPERNANPKDPAVPEKTDNKLSEEELAQITNRIEEIREMDKDNMTKEEKSELKNEMKELKNEAKRPGGTVYIGGASLLLIIILIIILV